MSEAHDRLDIRVPEPELMDDAAQARAYASADFADVNQGFVDRFRARFADFTSGRVIDLGCGPADIPLSSVAPPPNAGQVSSRGA